MANYIRKKLATGKSKLYYQLETEFEAVGTLFVNANMHYVAAHPQRGLWVSGMMANNNILPIGFVEWSNIKRIIVDDKNETVFIVVNDYDSIINNSDFFFRRFYKKLFTHTFEDSQEKAIMLNLDLFTGNILPYLHNKCNVVHEEIEVKGSVMLTIIFIVIIVIGALVVLLNIYDLIRTLF